MNIEENLNLVRKVLEMGGSVELKFHDIENETSAMNLITELQSITVPFEYDNNNGTHWYSADDYENSIETTIFFKKTDKEEEKQ